MVDTAWFVLLHRAYLIEQCTAFDFLSKFPKVKRWQQALLDVEALTRSAPQGAARPAMHPATQIHLRPAVGEALVSGLTASGPRPCAGNGVRFYNIASR
jgi:hypothetical protein